MNLNSVFPPEGLTLKARLNPILKLPLFQEVSSDFPSLESKEQLALAILSPLQVQGEDSGLRAWFKFWFKFWLNCHESSTSPLCAHSPHPCELGGGEGRIPPQKMKPGENLTPVNDLSYFTSGL